MNIPEGYQQVMPYLILQNAEKFSSFTKAVFGAVDGQLHHVEGSQKIMHGELRIGGLTFMYADANEQYGPDTGGFFIYVDNVDETYKLALSEGAKSIMPVEDKDYGRTCGVEDPCGNKWWVTESRS